MYRPKMLAYHFWIQYKLRYGSFVSGAVLCVFYSAVYHRFEFVFT